MKYGGTPPSCKCCKESIVDFLTIDHIQGGGRAERRKLNLTNSGAFFKHVLDEPYNPERYQVLCYNCNCSKRSNIHKVCPHKL